MSKLLKQPELVETGPQCTSKWGTTMRPLKPVTMKTKEKYEKYLRNTELREYDNEHRQWNITEKIQNTEPWLTSSKNMQSKKVYCRLVDYVWLKSFGQKGFQWVLSISFVSKNVVCLSLFRNVQLIAAVAFSRWSSLCFPIFFFLTKLVLLLKLRKDN